jgi:hypothetical protein
MADEEIKPTSQYTNSDKLGIALACLAGIMAIILFLVEKTPYTVVGLLALMIALSIYPIWHFASTRKTRIIFGVLAVIFAVVFGRIEWPKNRASISNTLPILETSPTPLPPPPSPTPEVKIPPKGKVPKRGLPPQLGTPATAKNDSKPSPDCTGGGLIAEGVKGLTIENNSAHDNYCVGTDVSGSSDVKIKDSQEFNNGKKD